MKARKRKKRRSSRTNNAPAPAVGAGVKTARRAATARRKLAKRALYVGQVLLLLLTADWVLQETGVEAHRVVAVSAYMLQGAGALLLAFEALPGAVAVFAPANRSALQTALFSFKQAVFPVVSAELLAGVNTATAPGSASAASSSAPAPWSM